MSCHEGMKEFRSKPAPEFMIIHLDIWEKWIVEPVVFGRYETAVKYANKNKLVKAVVVEREVAESMLSKIPTYKQMERDADKNLVTYVETQMNEKPEKQSPEVPWIPKAKKVKPHKPKLLTWGKKK